MSLVNLYTSKGCGYCPSVKKYLTKKGVDFVEKDIDVQVNAMELQWASGRLTTPTVIKGSMVVVGLNFGELAKLV